MWWKCIILCWTIMHEADMTDVSFNLTCLQFAIIIITYSLWKFSFLLKTWKLQEVFCYVPCPVRTWAIMGFHNFLSCVALSSFCPITISQSLFCHPFIKVWFSGISQWWYSQVMSPGWYKKDHFLDNSTMARFTMISWLKH